MNQNKKSIIIGFSNAEQKKDKVLGFSKGAYGYQASARKLQNEKDRAITLGPSGESFEDGYDEGDTIGCGLLIDKR